MKYIKKRLWPSSSVKGTVRYGRDIFTSNPVINTLTTLDLVIICKDAEKYGAQIKNFNLVDGNLYIRVESLLFSSNYKVPLKLSNSFRSKHLSYSFAKRCARITIPDVYILPQNTHRQVIVDHQLILTFI